MVNYLHEITVKSPSVHTPYNMSVIAPVCAFQIPSFCTPYGISVIALHQMKFLEETPGTTNEVKYPANFLIPLK